MNRVKVKTFGFPEIAETMGGTSVEIYIEGNTFGALLDAIEGKYGEDARKALLVQVMKNGKEWIDKEDMTIAVEDGDTFSFFTMIGGG